MTDRSLERRSVGVFALVFLLYGCGPDPKAPEPTVNKNAHRVSHLKITVEPGSGVNNIEVFSQWNIGNLGCAPTRRMSGSTIQKQIEVREKVEKLNGYFLATILEDRFVQDKCKWIGNADDIWFMRGHTILASDGERPDDFKRSNPVKLTCIPPPHIPLCELRSKEHFDRSHFKGVFNATVEILK